MITDFFICFKKASLCLDLKNASTEEQACQVRHAAELRKG